MRDYSKVSGQFWTGKTGRLLRGDMQAQIVALYLMTSPHANMIGVFLCPLVYIAHETGSPLEGASKGLQRLCEAGFCSYDDDSETVWVHEMARFQLGDDLKASDNRVKDIQKQYAALPESLMKQHFFEKYQHCFHLPEPYQNEAPSKPLRSPFEAPSKPGTGTGTETGTETGVNSTCLSDDFPPMPIQPVDIETETRTATMTGAICVALKSVGMSDVQAGNPNFKKLVEQGAEIGAFVEAGKISVQQKKGFGYMLGIVRNQMAQSAEIAHHATSQPQSSGLLPGAI